MTTEVKINLKHLTTIIEYFRNLKAPSIKKEVPENIGSSKIYLCTEGTIYLIIQAAKQLNYTNSYITLLNNNNYTIDEDGNVLFLTEKENTMLLGKELLDLLKILERKQYQAIFQYTKFSNSVYSEKILEDYLSQVKTFEIGLTSTEENPIFEQIFKTTNERVKEEYKEKKEVKVNDLITSFQKNLPQFYQTTIKKLQITNREKRYLLMKAKELEVDFYSLNIAEQQTLLEKWMLEYRYSNKSNIMMAQKALLTLGNETIDNKEIDAILAGLLILYGRILIKQNDIDYDTISLSGIEIPIYDSKIIQEKKEKVATLQTEMTFLEKNLSQIKRLKKLADIKEETEVLDKQTQKKEITVLENRGKSVENELSVLEQRIRMITVTKNNIDADLRLEIMRKKLEMMTNNNLKMQELCKNIEDGIVTINGKSSNIIIINTNPNTGRIIFEAHVDFEEMFEIMKCIEGKLAIPNHTFNS